MSSPNNTRWWTFWSDPGYDITVDLCRRWVDPDQAHDMAGKVFDRLYADRPAAVAERERILDFHDAGNEDQVRGRLSRISSQVCTDAGRRVTTGARCEARHAQQQPMSASPEETLEQTLLIEALNETLSDLPNADLLLLHEEGVSYAEMHFLLGADAPSPEALRKCVQRVSLKASKHPALQPYAPQPRS